MADKENDTELSQTPKDTDVENDQKKIKYPRAIPFIIVNEFCERFNYYGMRTILVLYLTRSLMYSEDSATVIYHAFSTMVYFICIFGGILADSWLGKFKTILYLSIVYTCGSVIIAAGALPALYPSATALTIVGLLLIAIGSGGIKPCVSAFGGDQFKLPEQVKQLAVFFSVFYFSINLGSFISTSVTPILRDVRCLGEDNCFALAFGVPAVLMVISILIFVAGKRLYVDTGLKGNMIVLVSKCIKGALSTRSKEKKTAPRDHWLDYAEPVFGKRLVNETKILMNVLVLYIPLPIFWTLFDQQGSRWTFQATRMDGDIGFYEIKPDQMQVVNPFLILAFIPLYEAFFYPLLAKIGISRPLQKITLGGILAGVAFVCSGLVEMQLEKTYPVIPSAGNAQLRIFNGMSCNYQVTTNIPDHVSFTIASMDAFQERYVKVESQSSFTYNMQPSPANAACPSYAGSFVLKASTATSYFMNGGASLEPYEDDPQKSSIGYPIYRTLINLSGVPQNMTMVDVDNDIMRFTNLTNYQELIETFPANYQLRIGNNVAGEIQLRLGGVYTLIVRETSASNYEMKPIEVSQPNSVSMLWLLPQYIIMTLGEVMYSVTGLQFSFEQAPESMKSVLQGFWMLTIAFGNLLVIIISGAKIFDSQMAEFFLFAGLMFADMAIFAYLAYRYKSLNIDIPDDEDNKAQPYTISDTSDKQL